LEFQEHLRGFDISIREIFRSLLGPDHLLSSEWVQRQLMLPIAHGGFGLTSIEGLAASAYLGAWASAIPLLADRFLIDGQPFLLSALMDIEAGSLGFQIHLRDARASLPDSVRGTLPSFQEFLSLDPIRLQADLSERMHAFTLSSILAEAPATDRARILSSGGKGAGGWLQATPAITHLRFTSDEFVTAARLRLGLSHPVLVGTHLQCPCGQVVDDTGIHLLRCRTGGETISVHDAVRDAVAQVLSGTLVQVRREVVLDLPGPPPQHIRADLTLIRDGRRTLADVVLANPLRQDIVGPASSQAGIAATRAVITKEEKYAARAPSDSFLPLAVEIFGRLHHQFDGLLRQAARDIHARVGSSGTSISVLTTHFRQRISVTLQRAQARAIHRRSIAITVGSHPPQQGLMSLAPFDISFVDLATTLDVDH
jgi:hypothetical protein